VNISTGSHITSDAPSKPARSLPHFRDRTFLPAAIEIVETPPSPKAVWLLLVICGFVAAAVIWCWFGRLDVYATARGKIEPTGQAKIIGPLDSGKVEKVDVANGQIVHAGDVLLALDTSEPEADYAAATQAMIAASAEAIRRQAALAAAVAGDWERPTAINWPQEIPDATRKREEEVLAGDLHDQEAKIASLQAQKHEKEAAVVQLDDSIAAEKRLIDTLNERVDLKQTLIDRNVGTKTGLLDAVQALRQGEAQLAGDQGKRGEAMEAVKSLDAQLVQTVADFIADQNKNWESAHRLADEKKADRVKAKVKVDRMTLRAPVDGVVQSLAVTSRGQVVTTGQELMHIVPSNTPVDILAYVTNDDIGFVTPGQKAVVKIDSFPFSRYGTLDATVEEVARDAIPADTANKTLTDPTKTTDNNNQGLTPTAKPTTDLVFETKLKPQTYFIEINGRQVPLSPGMTVTVEIKTDSRRILEYLFSPLVEVAGRAMRER
jgi:hemolysin D